MAEKTENEIREIKVDLARSMSICLREVGIDDPAGLSSGCIAQILRMTEEEVAEAIVTTYDDHGP